jgi:hypothetical protein
MAEDNKKYLDQIVTQVHSGRVVLFLGAGASSAAGGPTTPQLIELIKERFPNIDKQPEDIIDLFQEVVDTPPYSKPELEEFIREKLQSLQPTTEHKIMTKYEWAAIFTSNYDDLIEYTYRSTPDHRQTCIPEYSESPSVTLGDRSKVFLFKIDGVYQSKRRGTRRDGFNKSRLQQSSYKAKEIF